MNKSETIINLSKALLKAQSSMGSATKGATNPFFRSKYSDYNSVLEACKELINENGITILQPHVHHEGRNFVETVLVHESGEWVSSITEVVCAKQNDPQALGSAITYSRRYGLQSFLSIPSVDDDCELGMSRPTNKTTSTKESAPVAAKSAEVVAPKAVPTKTDALGNPATAKPSFFNKAPKATVAPQAEKAGNEWT